MECLLCLGSMENVTKCIEVDSVQWREFSIKQLIDKYLWSIELITSKDYICGLCWEELNGFHKFYTRLEEAHNQNKLLMKTEIDPFGEDMKPNDLQAVLIEPEIVISPLNDMPSVIKQEIQETFVSSLEDNSKVNDNFPLDGTHDVYEDNSDHGYTDNDDDLPLLPPEGHKRKCSKKSKAKQKTKTIKSQKSIKNIASKKLRESYNIPKLRLPEYDKFLQEHFKFTCNKCQETFESFRLLCQHYSKDHNEEGFAMCCETKFFKRNLLVDHINCHLNPEYFKCTVCGKTFTKRNGLLGHLKMHEEKTYCCDLCNMKFVQEYKLDKHKLTHLPESEKKFPCNECGKFYANEYILTQHQRAIHLNIYAKICEICGQTMPNSSSFKLHMEKHNGITTSTSAKCDICGLIVLSQRTLRLHKEEKHPVDGNREFNCHICHKVSPSVRALKKHIQEAHEMGYQYKCTVCAKEFKRRDNFKSHMAMHTGTPLYHCPWCPKEFNSNGNMHQHRKKAHPIEWEEARRKKYSGNLSPNF